MSDSLEVREAAGRAAAELRRRGLVKGRLFADLDIDSCRVCTLGAVLVATGCVRTVPLGAAARALEVEWSPLAYDVEREIGEHIPDCYGGDVGMWNDYSGRTVDEVLAVLDQIAAA